MATQEDQNFVTKTRNEFVLSAGNAIKEIHDKFANFHSQLDRGESDLINNVEKTQADILQKFDEITPKLKEIQQCRDSVTSILRNNTNKQFLDTQLHSFTTEIDGIIEQSGIDKLIGLKWKFYELPINDVCTFTTISAEWNRTRLYKNGLPIGDPNKDIMRDPGNTYPPNTLNKPQSFQLNPSRDADEIHRGNQPAEMFSGSDPSETQNYKSQTSSGELLPKLYYSQYQNPVLDIHSSTPRGAESPSVIHETNERTMVKPGSEGAFETKAFGKTGSSSNLHGIDEMRISRERKLSEVKEQGYGQEPNNNPNPGNPRPQKQYGKFDPYPQNQQTAPAYETKGYPNRKQDPHMYHAFPRLPPGAYQGQVEDSSRHLPIPNAFSRGVDSTQLPIRPTQPPASPYTATGELQLTSQDKRFPNDQFRAKDYIAYQATGKEAPIDPFRNYPKGIPKDGSSKPVLDKNTGVSDPNPARNQPPVAYPQHRNDPRFHHPHDYEMEFHGIKMPAPVTTWTIPTGTIKCRHCLAQTPAASICGNCGRVIL